MINRRAAKRVDVKKTSHEDIARISEKGVREVKSSRR